MARPRSGRPERGNFIKAEGGWWHVNAVWGDGETYLLTPLNQIEWPGRAAIGAPRVMKLRKVDQIVRQQDMGGTDDPTDPLKGSGR